MRGNPPPPEVNGDLDLYDISETEIHSNPRVKQVLREVEDKVFGAPTRIYQVFKDFDRDGDGYVSYADFED